jgi:hypothetical protein
MYPVVVECRSDFRYANRPLRLVWEGKKLEITRILDESAIPDGWMFSVLTASGQRFKLKYLALDDHWLGEEE